MAVGGCIAGDHLQTVMVVLEGGGEQALGDVAPRDHGAGGGRVKCKCNALHSFVDAAAAPQHG